MADSATVNHNLILPEIGASKDSWGTKLNQNMTKIDQLMKVGLGTFVNRAGDTMTGMLTLPTTNPTAGVHAAHKSYVDAQISDNVASLTDALVPKTRTLTGGSGITTAIGDLSADRTISVDDTVVRTTDNQTISGLKTFTDPVIVQTNFKQESGYFDVGAYDATYGGGHGRSFWDGNNGVFRVTGVDASGAATSAGIRAGRAPTHTQDLTTKAYVDGLDGENVKTTGNQVIDGKKTFTGRVVDIQGNGDVGVVFRDTNGLATGQIHSDSANTTHISAYSQTSSHAARISLTQSGDIHAAAGRYSGNGSGLSLLNATALSSGTVPNARMSGDYSWNNLDLTGQLRVTGVNAYASPAVHIEGTLPSIYLKQTDTPQSAHVAVNGPSFYVLSDDNGDGQYDSIALQLALDGSSLICGGKQVVFQNTRVNAGNGLTGGGTLASDATISMGTPGSITPTSTNAATATSHTHYISESTIRSLIADGATGATGTYAFLRRSSSAASPPGTTASGSTLTYSDQSDFQGGSTASGTWKCMGHDNVGNATLWMRIS